MEDATVIYPFFPAGVQRIIATGSTSYVGIINQDTVLKYPHEQHDQHGLKVEAAILGILGSHPRIIKLKGWDKEGVRLEYAHNGRLDEHLEKFAGSIQFQDRFRWARQAAEAVVYVHTKGVLHCDIRLGNLLLDKNFDIKLCDFQGIYQTTDGKILDGFAGESVKYSLPRQNPLHVDPKPDLFALGTAIYYIMQGHEPYPELHSIRDKEKIISLYQAGQFPEDLSVAFGGDIVRTCWNLGYNSADQIVNALKELETTIKR